MTSLRDTKKATGFDGFRDRSGAVAPFRCDKIEAAVQRAIQAVQRAEALILPSDLAVQVADRVMERLNNPADDYFVAPDADGLRIPALEDVQDLIVIVLGECGASLLVASAYTRYRRQREQARARIRVRPGITRSAMDVTDASLLLVESASASVTLPWDRRRIVRQLLDKTDLPVEEAESVAKSVENWIMAGAGATINTTLIRELVNNELIERGYQAQLQDLSLYGAPRDFVDQLMFTKSVENSNIVDNNPEAVNLGIAELVLKQWALDVMFSADVKRAHDTGALHLHDLGYPHRVYCSSHSIEYIKKYGLRGLVNLNTESKPARSASVLTGHLNTFLASIQAYYSGALGLAYINVMYAPLLEGMTPCEIRQIAQELIFNGAQNAFSRGGQTLFLDFNIHTGIPRYLRSVPAIGPGGAYQLCLADGRKAPLEETLRNETDADGYPLMDLLLPEADGARRLVLRETVDSHGRLTVDPTVQADLEARGEAVVTYGDYEEEARAFTRAMLEVWSAGDRHGRLFEFPKCDFHVSEETFADPEQYALFMDACRLAARNGCTYFIFDRDETTLSACCRLRTTIREQRMLRHPECLRFCGFQNVTVNVPQAAYRAAIQHSRERALDGLFEELDRTMELAAQAHLQKKERVADMMSGPGRPLWQIGRVCCDGKPYVDLDKCTYIIGLIGVNDAVRFLTGWELHQSREAMRLGLRIVAHMYLQCGELSRRHGLHFTLEESPAESASRRLAKTDLIYYGDKSRTVIKGADEEVAYYTNSVHLAAAADVTLVQRIREQAKFHSLIESGAITHAFIGEEQPTPEAIAGLVRNVFLRTQSAQLTVSPEFTYCNRCRYAGRGLQETCPQCGTTDVVRETRVVGYYSKVRNWNKSKRYGELPDRHAGRYRIEEAAEQVGRPRAAPRRTGAQPAGKPYRILVFGKKDCAKCAVLNKRLDKLLAKPMWRDVEKRYCDLDSVEGLVAFCEAECINPRRLPAMLMLRFDEAVLDYQSVPNNNDPALGQGRLTTVLGLQTDYSLEGRGVITTRQIESLLKSLHD